MFLFYIINYKTIKQKIYFLITNIYLYVVDDIIAFNNILCTSPEKKFPNSVFLM